MMVASQKNKLVVVLFYFLVIIQSYGQTPQWVWARSFGYNNGNYNEIPYSSATDTSGNIFVTGVFIGPYIIFDNDTLINSSIILGKKEVFLIKMDPAGNVIWARQAGGVEDEEAFAVCVDKAGNAIIAGLSNSPSLTFESTILIKNDTCEFFLAKYDSNGNLLWVKTEGELGFHAEYFARFKLITDANDNIIVAGHYKSNFFSIGTFILNNDSVPLYDNFIAKYNPSGTVLWAKKFGGTKSNFISSIVCDTQDNIYFTGTLSNSQILFGSDTLIVPSPNMLRTMVGMYDMNGNEQYAWTSNNFGSSHSQYGEGITIDPWNNIIVVSNILSGGIKVCRYNNQGVLLSSTIFPNGTGGQIIVKAITSDPYGNYFITGMFYSLTYTFGNQLLFNNGTWGAGTSDVFFVKFNQADSIVWATSVGGGEMDSPRSLILDKYNNLITTGFYQQSAISFGPFNLPKFGLDQMFVAKLGNSITGIENSDDFNGTLTIYPNPFSDVLTITFPDRTFNKISIKLKNSMGQLITKFEKDNLHEKSITIDNLGFLPNGFYLLEINADEVLFTNKIIKY